MWWVPFVPFGWTNLNVPEATSTHVTSLAWSFDPDEDMARAIAEELNNSRLFREVSFSKKATDADFVLRGVVKSTFYRGEQVFLRPFRFFILFVAARFSVWNSHQ